MINAIAAIGTNRALGKNNELLWHIPDDLKRYKALTLGHPVVMGRKTYESIFAMLKKPLPGRTNIIVTRSPDELADNPAYTFENVILTSSLEEAIEKAKGLDKEEIFIGGGSQIYEQALPLVDKLYLTLIDDEKEGDAYFPPYETIFTKKTFEKAREYNGLKYTWFTLEHGQP
ncbi:MAG TPA: dihydrofolate reductase [Candidatus Paceibacterota bacterium]